MAQSLDISVELVDVAADLSLLARAVLQGLLLSVLLLKRVHHYPVQLAVKILDEVTLDVELRIDISRAVKEINVREE